VYLTPRVRLRAAMAVARWCAASATTVMSGLGRLVHGGLNSSCRGVLPNKDEIKPRLHSPVRP
jgi:hypothetical protein